ncbi:hypothetical protein KNP414_03286 [Paenibacillus mucilaginosus KNP414]|uniref:Uncharacterized protein n=1 Tax=Paenibacillus mucilaginosus (strain KNP414) TaxID=1036673 RepID=F8FFC6_PAEMK|nr:hypothetical protein KNP414_03286 [Paenibacillus mucilaginosus KNP414]
MLHAYLPSESIIPATAAAVHSGQETQKRRSPDRKLRHACRPARYPGQSFGHQNPSLALFPAYLVSR